MYIRQHKQSVQNLILKKQKAICPKTKLKSQTRKRREAVGNSRSSSRKIFHKGGQYMAAAEIFHIQQKQFVLQKKKELQTRNASVSFIHSGNSFLPKTGYLATHCIIRIMTLAAHVNAIHGSTTRR